MKKVLYVLTVLTLTVGHLLSADKDSAKSKAEAPRENSSAAAPRETPEFAMLEARIAEQQEQIEQLRKTIEEQNKALEGITAALSAKGIPVGASPVLAASVTPASGSQSPAPAGLPARPVAAISPGVTAGTMPVIPKGPETASATAVALPGPQTPPPPPQKKDVQQIGPSVSPQERSAVEVSEAPLTIHLGTASITPVGFMDLTNTFRGTNSGASFATNFGSIPYNNTVGGHLTEDKISAGNSRIGFRVDAMFKDWHVLGYYEGDFVGGYGNGAFNTQVSSNSLLYRIRLYWVDTRKGPFEMLAGQSWSMMTPNRRHISALPGDLFYGQEFDVNYLNGLTWGRIPGIRFLYHGANNRVTAGLSLENATQYFGGSGGGGTPTLPSALASLSTTQLDANQANGIALPNVHPDIIAKIAFDPNSHVHAEFGGVASTVKIFNPNTLAKFTKTGGGGFVNGNFELVKNFRLITNNYWSDGGGRYMFGLAPNFIVRADGSPSLVHSGSTVDGFEAVVKNSVIYAYYGGVYVGRNTARDLNGSLIGYGYAGSANGQNRTIQEGTIGINQTFWKDPKYGALSMFLQYAYFFRNPWFVAPGAPKEAHQNAVWFDLRYTLPGSAPAIKY